MRDIVAPVRRGLEAGMASEAAALAAAFTLALGGGLAWMGLEGASAGLWAATAGAALAASCLSVMRQVRRGRLGVDAVAVLALAGALVVGELLAGAVIALMLASGRALEARASRRARRELSALVARVPASARRVDGASLTTVSLDEIQPGEVILVAPSEVIPLDGGLLEEAFLDESPLTGEAVPVRRARGELVRSGVVNAGAAFRLEARLPARESTYAQVVRLVRAAEQSRAPLVRMADRFAVWFVPATLAVAALAGILSQSLTRAVAVLVVATPCPLILAAPIALVGGMSRSARRGVVVKGGAVLEILGKAGTVLFDKTGTLTRGAPTLARVEVPDHGSRAEALWFAASLEQASTHPLARPIVEAALAAGQSLALPRAVREEPGQGICGRIADQTVRVGRAAYVTRDGIPAWAERLRRDAVASGRTVVFLGTDSRLRAGFLLEDPLRPDAPLMVQRLREAGIGRVVMVTGDHLAAARRVAMVTGLDEVYADCTPQAKLTVVQAERRGAVVVMVGDGINDAPSLAAADVGIAIGARGATAASEVADAVLMNDRIERVGDAVEIARRSRAIALQSMAAGMALSGAAMALAGIGLLAPVVGAAVQEVIDAAVILNALRAARERRNAVPVARPAASAWQGTLREHGAMRTGTAALIAIAAELGRLPAGAARRSLEEARRFLCDEVILHERREEELLYPLLIHSHAGAAMVETARREHAQVARETAALTHLLDTLTPGGPTAMEVEPLRDALERVHDVLTLHRAHEEEQVGRTIDGVLGEVSAPRSAALI